jgi:hypothetical protein
VEEEEKRERAHPERRSKLSRPSRRRPRLPFYISRGGCKKVKKEHRKYNQGVKSFSSNVTSFIVLVVATVSCPSRSECCRPKWVRPSMGKWWVVGSWHTEDLLGVP